MDWHEALVKRATPPLRVTAAIAVTVCLLQTRRMRPGTLFKATLLELELEPNTQHTSLSLGGEAKGDFKFSSLSLFPLMLNNGHVCHQQSEPVKLYNIILKMECRNCHTRLSPSRSELSAKQYTMELLSPLLLRTVSPVS